jgi:hypothetical protein
MTYGAFAPNLPQTCHVRQANHQNTRATAIQRRRALVRLFDDKKHPCYFSISPSEQKYPLRKPENIRGEARPHASTDRQEQATSNDKFSVAEFASLFGIDSQTLQAAVMQAAIERKRDSGKPFFTIPELAHRWSCSRGSVYNYLREAGARIVDFAPPGKKGKKLVPLEVVERIERQRTKRIE